jgi:hypothetical protein
MHDLLLDQAATVRKAQQLMDRRNLTARCEIVGGDFFAAIPSGYDRAIKTVPTNEMTFEDGSGRAGMPAKSQGRRPYALPPSPLIAPQTGIVI